MKGTSWTSISSSANSPTPTREKRLNGSTPLTPSSTPQERRERATSFHDSPNELESCRSARLQKFRLRTSTRFPSKNSLGFLAMKKSKNAFASTCVGTLRWLSSTRTRTPTESADIFLRMRHQRCFSKLASTTSSEVAKVRSSAITCTCRDTPHLASTRAPISKAA